MFYPYNKNRIKLLNQNYDTRNFLFLSLLTGTIQNQSLTSTYHRFYHKYVKIGYKPVKWCV